jgi:hypothetical protein
VIKRTLLGAATGETKDDHNLRSQVGPEGARTRARKLAAPSVSVKALERKQPARSSERRPGFARSRYTAGRRARRDLHVEESDVLGS